MPDPEPGPGEVRIRIAASGINPGDVKKRRDEYRYGMPYPRVIPHSDGAGHIDRVGAGVSSARLGTAVWCYGAQSYRPFGTAAEYTVVPAVQAVPLPEGVSLEQGACLGIPGITAHRAVSVAGEVKGRTVLVHGAAGAVGACAVQLAARAGALVIATVRSSGDEAVATEAGAHHVLRLNDDFIQRVQTLAPAGVDHIVEVAFGANVHANVEVLALGGSIAAYATDVDKPAIPFWPLLFKNIRVDFLGSDDFPAEAKTAGALALNEALTAGWKGLPIAERVPLSDIARAHDLVEHPNRRGRVIVSL
jgi:NADPH2:quinone reductase